MVRRVINETLLEQEHRYRLNLLSINEQISSMVLVESSNQENETIIKKALKDLSISGSIVFQFGTGIGAFMGPVKSLLVNHGVSASKEDVALLLITSVYIMGNHSKDEVKILYKKLKDRDLDMYVDDVTDFINKSKSILTKIASKMGKTVSSLIDALGFTFILVPTMDILHNLIMNNGLNFDSFVNMFSGIALALSSYVLKSLIDKKGLKEEIDSDWDWVDGVEIDYKYMTEDDLNNLLKVGDVDIFEGGSYHQEYILTLNREKYLKMYGNSINHQSLPIFLCWKDHGFGDDKDGCVGYSHEEVMTIIKTGEWEIVD